MSTAAVSTSPIGCSVTDPWTWSWFQRSPPILSRTTSGRAWSAGTSGWRRSPGSSCSTSRNPKCPLVEGVAAMSKYAVFFTLKGEAIARAMEQPSDRVMGVSKAVESAGGKLEAYYLMFGQYDGFVIVDLPDSRAAAATSLAVSSTGAFEHLETHELIEAEDLNPILEQAKGITSQLPGT